MVHERFSENNIINRRSILSIGGARVKTNIIDIICQINLILTLAPSMVKIDPWLGFGPSEAYNIIKFS